MSRVLVRYQPYQVSSSTRQELAQFFQRRNRPQAPQGPSVNTLVTSITQVHQLVGMAAGTHRSLARLG
jgi:hypothetical protein